MSERETDSTSESNIIYWVIIILVFGFLALIIAPNIYIGERKGPGLYSNACINNMRQIDAAANQFALENHLTNGDAINFPNDITNYIKLNRYGKIPPCPSGGIYTLKKIGDKPTCSLSNTVPPHILP